MLATAQEMLDLQVLLDPFEEPLNLLALFVKVSDFRCRALQVVGDKHQHLLVLCSYEGDAPQRNNLSFG